MSQKELNRVAVITQCVKGTTSVRHAAALLQLSARQVKRLKLRFRSGGAAALAHAGRERASPRRTPAPVRQRILRLARTTYAGFNDHHLTEKLREVEGLCIGRETLRQLLRAAGIGPPRQRRPPAHRQRRARRAREGEMLQVDGSPHDWLEGRGPQITLLGFQDDATSKVVGAQFFPSESAEGYFRVWRSVLRRYGVPLSLYGDRCSVFVRNDDHWSIEEQLAGRRQPTQFGRALAQLGVTFIPAHSPQAKGRIERLWGVFQDRLRSELRLAAATDLESANAVLRRFLPDFNRRFGRAPAHSEKAWRPAPRDLDRICCFIHERIVSNDNVVQWDGRRFQIPPQPRRFSFAGARVQLLQDLAGRIAVYHGDTKLQVRAL
ncbi:MAG: ISNCY family transposase [Candidatus Acidiferrales bacterium]